MAPNTQHVPGYFVWDAPGQPLSVHLHLDVVDRLSAEIMRGFGLVPKRGAEVGGILLGSIEAGERSIVRVDDFVPVSTEYRRGPSFLPSEAEQENLAVVVESARGGPRRPIGYYRSHTRDGAMVLGPEDLELLNHHFPDARHVALLVRPFATKVSTAGFLVRANGTFPDEAPAEFPFRRREMTGEEAPARRSMMERGPRPRRMHEEEEPVAPRLAEEPPTEIALPPSFTPAAAYSEPPPRPIKRGWMWVPLCFLFLMLGVALGYQTALTFAPELREREGAKQFALDVTAGRNGDTLTVRWDRDSPAVRAADRGVMEIEDGASTKSVALDVLHLREGSIGYQNGPGMVKFRLVLYIGTRVTLTETVDWTP